jgi:hypothetical protein
MLLVAAQLSDFLAFKSKSQLWQAICQNSFTYYRIFHSTPKKAWGCDPFGVEMILVEGRRRAQAKLPTPFVRNLFTPAAKVRTAVEWDSVITL